MVKHTDLERKKETLITKLTTAENKLQRAKREHQLLLERLEEKIESYKKELDIIENNTIEKIQCCGLTFKSKTDLEKHKLTQNHKRNNEPHIMCNVCKQFIFGINKTDYDSLMPRDKRKYKYYSHYNECCFCPDCLEEFHTSADKSNHKCEVSVEELNDVDNCYDTMNDIILIDEEFDYFRLQDLTRNHIIQFEEYMEKNIDTDFEYNIKQENLYYIVTEHDDNDSVELCRFKIPTRKEDYNKPLTINSGLKEI